MYQVVKSLIITAAIAAALIIIMTLGAIGYLGFIFFCLGAFVYKLSRALSKYSDE